MARLVHLVRHGEAGPDGELTARGRRQADLLGERLAGWDIAAIEHGPASRATATAEILGARIAAPVTCATLLDDTVPPVGDRLALPPSAREFLRDVTDADLARDAAIARAASDHYAVADGPNVLLVTHAFVVAWFVSQAFGAADGRWLGVNAANASLTTIRYWPDRPAALVTFNDLAHLPESLRWTGFPSDLGPA